MRTLRFLILTGWVAFAQDAQAPPTDAAAPVAAVPVVSVPSVAIDLAPLAPADPSSPYASPRDAARHRFQATLAELESARNVKAGIQGFAEAFALDRTYAPAAFNLAVLAAMVGLPGLGAGGLPGLGGLGRSNGLGALSAMESVGSRSQLGALSQFLPAQNYSVHADPQGSSTSGFVTLWNSPRVDTHLAYTITGKRVAVGFSGNHFFHPFAWDAIHMFELDYDDEGRVRHAWELDEPNAPRLDFTWDGKRLMSVTGHATSSGEPVVYSRTLTYSGDRLMSETITQGGKTAHIQYKYNKQGVLIEAESDSDPSIDGRSRKVEFLDETSAKGRS